MDEKINGKKISRKAIAWILVAVLVVAAVIVVVWYSGSDLKYNNDLRKQYNHSIDNLEKKLYEITPGSRDWVSSSIEVVRFGETKDEKTSIEVIAKGIHVSKDEVVYKDAFYKIDEKLYTALVAAEYSNNFDSYFEALNECFQNMEFSSSKVSSCSPDLQVSKENAVKFNELFNLSTVQTSKDLKQVGFLPQYIQYEGSELTSDGKQKANYTFKGLSFVEVAGEEGDGILPSKNSVAIMSGGVDKNKVQIFETNFQFGLTFDQTSTRFIPEKIYKVVIEEILNGESSKFNLGDIKVTHFKSVNAFDKMQLGSFNFEKPNKNI